MTALSQSAFLYALGWALMNSLWQMALLWLIYQLGFNLHKKIKPAIRNLAGVSLLFAGFLWFILSFAGKIIEFNAVQKYLITLPATEETPLSLNKVIFDSSSGLQSLIRVAEQYLPYLSSAYLIILLLLITRLINAFSYSQRLRNEGLIAIDEHWQLFVKKYAGKLGLSKPVQVYLSSLIDVPATLGYIKPVILLPVTLFNHLSVQQAEAVILHEISHIRRNDYLINILLSVIETILFFNPFSHLLAKNIKKEREMCCDDFVVRCQYDPHSYAAALLSLEKMRITAPAFAMAATGNKDQLLNRVKRILNVNSGNLNYGQRLLALFVMAGIISSMAWLSPSTENKSSKRSSEGKEAVTAAELFNKTEPGKKLILVKKEGKKDSLIRMAQNKKPVTYQFDDLYVKSGPLLDTFVFDGDVMETEDLPEKLPFPVEERRIALAPLFSPDAPL
ncbi:MAG: M56 family metallopeptidase, partial [Chitinophagaceae bacterium]|nr:M56 family metallopeptidase [Chitinophagaceae bacterium]